MAMRNAVDKTDYDPVYLEVFKHLFSSISEEMGSILRKTSFSPNIKERRDFSCAIFNSSGLMIAQAAHIPVHLGSMPLSVLAAINAFPSSSNPLRPGDMVILNDPYLGGTHLPDITLVAPVFTPDEASIPFGFVATRAHHADVGGMTPGSMPISREIYQEGLIIPPIRFVNSGQIDSTLLDFIAANVRTPHERRGDIKAQIAANLRGVTRIQDLISRFGVEQVSKYMDYLLAYTERMTRQLLTSLPDGVYTFMDYLDDDGIGHDPVPICSTITIQSDQAIVDFTGSAPQQSGCINAVYAITLSAVYYVFRCLIGLDVPNNSGCLLPIQVIAPEGSIVNAQRPAAVAGGNVETSQRIVDVLLGALAKACPDRIPAASQGTMNNLTIGGWDQKRQNYFTYYETIGGGTGAQLGIRGQSAIHSHMTNTLNTPVEAIEYSYPLRVIYYGIRRGSGGAGQWQGGDGIQRDIQVLNNAQATLLSDRRIIAPYGLAGGCAGAPGENTLLHHGQEITLDSKGTYFLNTNDIISIKTPGGGGFGMQDPINSLSRLDS
jgi:N-methylhydantoinase B